MKRLHIIRFLVAGLALPVLTGCADVGLRLVSDKAGERIRTPVRINGRPVAAVVDTGAGAGYVVVESALGKLGIEAGPRVEDPALKPGQLPFWFAGASRWRLLGSELEGLQPVIMTEGAEIKGITDFDAIIGWPALRQNIWVFDLAEGRIEVTAKVPDEAKGWIKFQIGADNVFVLRDLAEPARHPALLIDTGDEGGMALPPEMFEAWRKAHPDLPVGLKADWMIGQDGWRAVEEYWADEFALGSLVVRDVPIAEIQPASQGPFPGEPRIALGLAALKRLELVIDGPNGVAYVRPAQVASGPYEYGRLGAVFIPSSDDASVLTARTARGGPADAAGLRDGDVLLRVDGRAVPADPAGQRDLMVEWRSGKKRAGTKYDLLVRRGDAILPIPVVSQDYFGETSGRPEKPGGQALSYQPAPVALRRNEDEISYATGAALLGANKFLEASAEFDHTIALNPAMASAYLGRGGARYALKDDDAAITALTQAIALQPQATEPYVFRALARRRRGDFSGAVADFDRAEDRGALDKNDRHDLYENRGFAKANLNDHAGAIDDYSRAIGLNPDRAWTYYSRGLSRANLDDFAGTIADCDRAIALEPGNADAWLVRAKAKANEGDLAGARSDCDRVVVLAPENPDAYVLLGKLELAAGRADVALGDFDRAIRLDSRNAEAYRSRAQVRFERADLPGSIADYSAALAINPKDVESLYNRGNAAYNRGDLAAALADYDQVVGLVPGEAQPYFDRGVTRDRLGKHAEALADLDRAIALRPDYLEAYAARATAREASGDSAGAAADRMRTMFQRGPQLDLRGSLLRPIGR